MKEAIQAVVEAEANRRLNHRHLRRDLPNSGFYCLSGTVSTAPKNHEPLLLAYYRGQSESRIEVLSKKIFSTIPSRQGLAILIKFLREDHRKKGVWAESYSTICSNIDTYKRTLDWNTKDSFVSPAALKAAAARAERSIANEISKVFPSASH